MPKHPSFFAVFRILRLALVVLEALAAVDGTIVAGLERDLRGCAALCANRVEHLALLTAATLGLTVGTACLAADGLVFEAFLRVEFLFTGGENEFCTAVLANQSLVFEHDSFFPLCLWQLNFLGIRATADLVFAPTHANGRVRS